MARRTRQGRRDPVFERGLLFGANQTSMPPASKAYNPSKPSVQGKHAWTAVAEFVIDERNLYPSTRRRWTKFAQSCARSPRISQVRLPCLGMDIACSFGLLPLSETLIGSGRLVWKSGMPAWPFLILLADDSKTLE
jgi:hypothetical protein